MEPQIDKWVACDQLNKFELKCYSNFNDFKHLQNQILPWSPSDICLERCKFVVDHPDKTYRWDRVDNPTHWSTLNNTSIYSDYIFQTFDICVMSFWADLTLRCSSTVCETTICTVKSCIGSFVRAVMSEFAFVAFNLPFLLLKMTRLTRNCLLSIWTFMAQWANFAFGLARQVLVESVWTHNWLRKQSNL